MGLFKKKNAELDDSKDLAQAKEKLDFMTQIARNKTINDMEKSIRTTIKEKRLTFNADETADYTDRQGNHGVYSEDELASVLWGVFDKKLQGASAMGITAGLFILAITEADIKSIVQKVRNG